MLGKKTYVEPPQLDDKSLSLFALGLALLGLLALYFWPQTTPYEKISPALAAIAEDGAKVEVAGMINSITEKESSTSIKICDVDGKCISASAQKNALAGNVFLKGDAVSAFGTISSYQGAKFLRADKIMAGSALADTAQIEG